MIAWTTWAVAALAQSACSNPFTAEQVRALAAASTEALLADDALAHKRLWDELADRAECLDHQLADDQWARILLNEALVRKATGKDWQRALDTALRAFPALDVPTFLREEFRPLPKPTPSGVPVPEDVTLFLDGVLSPEVPLLDGDHVVQAWRDGRFRSAWLEDGAQIPAEWLVPKPKEVVRVVEEDEVFVPRAYGMAGVFLGPTLGRQLVDRPAEALGNQEQYGGWFGLATAGAVPVAGSVGFFWDATGPVMAPSVRQGTDVGFQSDDPAFLPEGWLGAAGVFEELTVGIGGGVATLLHYEQEEPVLVWYPQPHLLLGLHQGRRDVEVSGGLTPAALHGALRVGALLTEPKKVTPRLGVDTHLGVGWFREGNSGDRRSTALQWSVLGRLDVAWGRDR